MDENQPTTPVPIACRYMPHDQWFVTHIQPNWRIKTIKLWLLSKCLNIPFQPQSPLMSRRPAAHPPEAGDDPRPSGRASPITFAPGPRKRRISPIMFAAPGRDFGPDSSDEEERASVGTFEADVKVDDGGYEEDDEYDMDDDEDGFVDIGGLMSYKPSMTVGLSARTPTTPAPRSYSVQQFLRGNNQTSHQKPKQPAIPIDTYTVLRYTTGQILEDDFLFAWYDIRPYELFELHSAYTPSPYTASTTYHPSSNRPTPTHIPHLPRAPQLYIAPYWEGWVRALRVVRQIVLEYAPGNQDPGSGMHMGLGFGLGPSIDGFVPGYDLAGLSGGGSKKERRVTGRKITTKAEWGTRWVVIREGVITINRHQEDPSPTHQFALTSLMSLHGADYFQKSSYSVSLRAASTEKGGEPEEEPKRIVCAKFRRIGTRGEGTGHVDYDGVKKRERDAYRDAEVEGQRPARRQDLKDIRRAFGAPYHEPTTHAPPAKDKGKGRADHVHLGQGRPTAAIATSSSTIPGTNPVSSPSASSDDEGSSYLTAGKKSRPRRPHTAPTLDGRMMAIHDTAGVGSGHSSTDSLALSSPVFAHSTDSDGSMDYSLTHGMSGGPSGEAGHRYGYRYGYRFDSATKTTIAAGSVENDEAADQEWEKPRKLETKRKPRNDKAKAKARAKKDKGKWNGKEREKEREKAKDPETRPSSTAPTNVKDPDEKGEWIVLDMSTDAAYSSILRIFHRHFSPPISSSFIPSLSNLPPSTPTPTPAATPFSSPISPRPPTEGSLFPHPSWTSTQESINTNTASASSATFIGTESGHASADQEEEEPETPGTLGNNPHPAALVGLEHHARGVFGPLPYPEWRLELVERARLSGVGDVGKPMLYFLGGHVESADEKRHESEGDSERQPPEKRGKGRDRAPSHGSTATSPSTISQTSDTSDDLGHRFGVSDSGEESSELEWQGWMADLPRQNRVFAQRGKEVVPVPSILHTEGEKPSIPSPHTPAEDQRRFREGKRALEPSGVVTSMLSSMWNSALSTASLVSRSSAESLTQRPRTRAFSFGVPGIEGNTASPSTASSHTHSHSYSQSHPRLSHGGPTLYHSTSLYDRGLRSEVMHERPQRRPSMPTLSQVQPPPGAGIRTTVAPAPPVLPSPPDNSSLPSSAGPGSISSSPLPIKLGPKHTVTGAATMPRRASSAGMPISGSVGRSTSVLLKSGLLRRRDGDGDRQSEKAKRQEGKGKEKEHNKERPKLSLATSGAAQDPQPPAVRSPTMSTAKSLLRRVRSSSSLVDAEGGGTIREERKKPMNRMGRFVRGLDSALEFGDGKS